MTFGHSVPLVRFPAAPRLWLTGPQQRGVSLEENLGAAWGSFRRHGKSAKEPRQTLITSLAARRFLRTALTIMLARPLARVLDGARTQGQRLNGVVLCGGRRGSRRTMDRDRDHLWCRLEIVGRPPHCGGEKSQLLSRSVGLRSAPLQEAIREGCWMIDISPCRGHRLHSFMSFRAFFAASAES